MTLRNLDTRAGVPLGVVEPALHVAQHRDPHVDVGGVEGAAQQFGVPEGVGDAMGRDGS